MENQSRIVIIGAGVIGLTTALVLADKGYPVTVIAAHYPRDNSSEYTSIWAGAHFRPFPSASESDLRERNYTRETLKFFAGFSQQHPEASIRFTKGADWLEAPSENYKKIPGSYRDGLSNFEDVSSDESLPPGVKFACSYDTWVLNAPLYVEFLHRRLETHYGVEFKRQKLASLKEVYSIYKDETIGAVINATAFGLQFAGGYDPLTYPVRGQILALRIPPTNRFAHETITHQAADGSWTYVINRPCDGGCVLGGTRQVDDRDPNPRESDTLSIKKRAKALFPELFVKELPGGTKDLDIIRATVGFRPTRKGGSRVEAERVEGHLIVHAYGISGMGFESSYGMALHAVSLMESEISGPLKA